MRRSPTTATISRPVVLPVAVPRTARLGFHEGNILELAANKYPSLREAVLEAIQNSIDAGATKVNVNINQSARSIFIHDNGRGASIEFFNSAIECIGDSKKEQGKLGQFGLGVVSALNKCKVFTFSSRPSTGENGLMQWTFESEKIKGVKSGLTIPVVPRAVASQQWWNSELMIFDYTTDQMRAKIDMDVLCEQVIDRYNEHMQKNRTVVVIKLTSPGGKLEEKMLRPTAYTGGPIPVKVYTGPVAGDTAFQMYIAKTKDVGRRKERTGRVKVVDSTGYGILLSSKVLSGLLTDRDVSLLTSGLFEGEIRFSAKVRVEASRRYFEETEALMEACGHIEQWLQDVGQDFIKKMEDESTTERYQQLGQQSLKVIRHLLKQRPDLATIVKSFNYGSVGREHAETGEKKEGKVDAKSIDGSGKKSIHCGDPGEPRERSDEPKERKEHKPLVVGGQDGGQTRTFIRDSSYGLILQHGTVQNSNLWHLDENKGVLTINIYHPTWEVCDSVVDRSGSARNKMICDLQERIVLHALHLLKLKKELGADGAEITPIVEIYASDFMSSEVFLITDGDRLGMRGQFVDRRGKERKAAQESKKSTSVEED